jgi:hypothetical protein
MKTRALRLFGVVIVALAIAGNALAAAPSQTSELNGAGVQSTPGGIVKDNTGGYYDPARSTYVPASPHPATGGVQTKPGGIVKDNTGGYYDPARSIYITANGNATPALAPVPTRGFSWTDATVGAGVATGAILVLLGATLLTLRRRTLAA